MAAGRSKQAKGRMAKTKTAGAPDGALASSKDAKPKEDAAALAKEVAEFAKQLGLGPGSAYANGMTSDADFSDFAPEAATRRLGAQKSADEHQTAADDADDGVAAKKGRKGSKEPAQTKAAATLDRPQHAQPDQARGKGKLATQAGQDKGKSRDASTKGDAPGAQQDGQETGALSREWNFGAGPRPGACCLFTRTQHCQQDTLPTPLMHCTRISTHQTQRTRPTTPHPVANCGQLNAQLFCTVAAALVL